MREVCVCPGSYDPVTAGHLDLIRRAAAIFDRVVVAVLFNPAKQGTFAVPEREAHLLDALADLDGVRVASWANTLLVDVCREVGAQVVVKGIRGEGDVGYELGMAAMNRQIGQIETVFLSASPELAHLSSSLVRQVALLGGDVSGMVTERVRADLEALRPGRG